jgi:hypothetical protein
MSNINWDDPNPLYMNPQYGVDLEGNAPSGSGIPLPTYGNHGGPNKSGPGEPVDKLDALFMKHDQAILDGLTDRKTPGVLTPDEMVDAHANLFNAIDGLPQSGGLVLGDAGATLYSGLTIFALTGQLAQLDLLEKLEVALDPKDRLDPAVFDDVSAALSEALAYMEAGLAGLTPTEAGEARSLSGLLPVLENQFADFLIG